MKKLLVSLVLLAGCAGMQSMGPPPTAEPVIAAERAFAADAAQRGWIAAFRSYAAADATTLSPGPVNAQENLARQQGDGSTNLAWGPSYAGIARSGDFGFTTGPFWLRTREGVLGHYFTVWRKQADGSWKWIFDGGTDVTGSDRAVETGAIPMLTTAPRGGTEESAVTEVRALEGQIANGNALPAVALANHLAEDAHVNRAGAPAAIGREAGSALARQTTGLGFGAPIRMAVASSGDLAFTLGEARWNEGDAAKTGYYARIWQRRADGWVIVFDEIVPNRGP